MAEQAWFSDQTVVFIQEYGGTEINATVKVLNVNESGFERETEGVPTFGGAKITKKLPQADGEVEIEMVLTNTMADKIFWGSTVAGTAPASVTSDGEQNAHRVVLLRTAATVLPTSATAAVTGETYRKTYVNAYAVTLEPEQAADDFLKATLTFKISPTDSDAAANVTAAYDATSMTGLSAYTA